MSPIKAQFSTRLNNEAATSALGHCLAQQLTPGLIIYLHGDLGSGKTTLTRALLHAAGFAGRVKSPTYTLAESYQINLPTQSTNQLTSQPMRPTTVMHFDLYRMTCPEEFLEAGFRDVFNGTTICIVEWPENGAAVLPRPDLEIFLTLAGMELTARQIELHALSEKGSVCLHQLNFAPNL